MWCAAVDPCADEEGGDDGWEEDAPATRSRIAYRLTPDDWRGGDAIPPDAFTAYAARVLAELGKQQRGIVLFHDTQAQTARMLPALLHDLKQQGYRVVHVAAR